MYVFYAALSMYTKVSIACMYIAMCVLYICIYLSGNSGAKPFSGGACTAGPHQSN